MENQQHPLMQSWQCLHSEDCTAFYSLLNNELKNYLENKLSISADEVNSKKISLVLDKKGIPNKTVLELEQLISDIEWMLYTPFERSDKMNILYNQAHEMIQLLNSYETGSLNL